MPEDAPQDTTFAYRFDRFELRPGERVLLADGEPVKLGGRGFDMLVALVQRHTRVVSKRELMELVWPKLIVEENNLQVQVMALRKLLGPASIATVPGRGYRVTLAVEEIGAASVARTPAAGSSAPAAAAPRKTNLPAHLPPMFGRDADLAALRELVAAHGLVSIVGAGGIGKTRLGQALVEELAGTFPDGAWMVELASLADPALVPSAVARVIGIALVSERAPADVVASNLRGKRMLLVLDNCEHLIDGVIAMVEPLRRDAPDVRILVTSQEPLKTVDEQVYRLATLSLPAGVDVEDALRSSAVELFVAAAKSADPRFALSKRNAGAVVEICRHLDGIPLALQLAAARVPLLGIEGLRARLHERFHVLTGGARTVLRRHQTLRGALEWSHGLLTAEEQAVYRRLGVFAGSFSLEAAQQVAADNTLSEWQVLDVLGALVDKSLLVVEGEGTPRYRLLETTRAFALERLGEAGETDEYLHRHAEVLRDLVRSIAATQARTPERFAALAAEIDNARAAIAWARAAPGERILALELIAEAYHVWYANALSAETLACCVDARALVDASTPPQVEARFWMTMARAGMLSARAECLAAASRAAAMFRALGDRQATYLALAVAAMIASRRGAIDEVATAIREAAPLEDPAWPVRQRTSLCLARYFWCLMDGRYAEALEAMREQAALCRQEGNVIGEQLIVGNVALVLAATGQSELAVSSTRHAYTRLEELGVGAVGGHILYDQAVALLNLGRHEEMLEASRKAHALLQREGDHHLVLEPLALCAAMQGRHADAARIAGFVDALYAKTGDVRRHPQRMWRESIDALLASALDDGERETLQAEGGRMSEDEVFALALRIGGSPTR